MRPQKLPAGRARKDEQPERWWADLAADVVGNTVFEGIVRAVIGVVRLLN